MVCNQLLLPQPNLQQGRLRLLFYKFKYMQKLFKITAAEKQSVPVLKENFVGLRIDFDDFFNVNNITAMHPEKLGSR